MKPTKTTSRILTALAASALVFLAPPATATITIDGQFGDWSGNPTAAPLAVDDPADLGDSSGDIRRIEASVEGDNLILKMTVESVFGPSLQQTSNAGTQNRYYYHWLIDSDNNPATGFTNAEYEGNPTGLAKPLGADIVVQLAWRDGAPENGGTYAYDPLTDTHLVDDYPYTKSSASTVVATIPFAELGLSPGQTIAISAFQEGASNGWEVDWIESVALTIPQPPAPPLAVDDPADLGDSSGDIRRIEASVEGDNLVLKMTVESVFGPSLAETSNAGTRNRYYYHWLIDSDNNPATGFTNAEYEGNPTGLAKPVGADIVVQLAWRDGAPENGGTYAYDPLTDTHLVDDYPYTKSSASTVVATIPFAELGLSPGQTIAISAFQEGASNGWQVDWIESAELTIPQPPAAPLAVDDPADLGDSSGDIRRIEASVEGDNLVLKMTVESVFGPSLAETSNAGTQNRYYYHWLIDSDNNPATGFTNAEYEGNPTGLAKPVGADIVVQLAWRDGAPENGGTYAYDPLTDTHLVDNYPNTKSSASTVVATIPFAELGLSRGQTIAISAFQEGASNGWQVDWIESGELTIPSAPGSGIIGIEDPADLGDSSGDIRLVQATTDGTNLFLRMQVESVFGPSVEQTSDAGTQNRYYYHWLIDSDNNPATGFTNAEYEGNPTGLAKPVGADIVVQLAWRDGTPENGGTYAYDPLTDIHLADNYDFAKNGDSVEAVIALADLGLALGQTIAVSAFQEGASNGWQVDWIESASLTLAPPSDLADLVADFSLDPFGFWVALQDEGGDAVDPATLAFSINGSPVAATAEKTGTSTTAAGIFTPWLPGGEKHTLTVTYRTVGSTIDRTRNLPFNAPAYSVLNPDDRASAADPSKPGFLAGVTQISGFQGFTPSQHNNQSSRAEKQFAGSLRDEFGAPFYNEASDVTDRWVVPTVDVPTVINWHEVAPGETGHFRETNGYTDAVIPEIDFIADGLVVEILTFLELEAGFHLLAVNTTGGFKFSTGPDGRDLLGSVVDEYNGSQNYSSFGDHYFSVLAPEDGLYPVRLLWFHSKRTSEDAQLEFYSVAGKRKVLINDSTDPDSIKAYRAATGTPPYISAVGPAPGNRYATQDTPVELVITGPVADGSVVLTFDGNPVAATVVVGAESTLVTYQPVGLAWGSTHEVVITYQSSADPPVSRTGRYSYSLFPDAPVLPVAWSTPPGSGTSPGFAVRTAQSQAARANTVAAAEAQLAGAPGFNATATPLVINYGLFDGDFYGLFEPDDGLNNQNLLHPTWDFTNVSMEVLTYLDLPAGAHTLGVNSDDGFLVTAGPDATDKAIELDRFDGSRATSTEPQSLFDIIVETPGVYGFRLVWFQGEGDASVEWYSFDRQTEIATLLNDPTAGSIKAFRSRSGSPVVATISIRRVGGEVVIEWTGSVLEENPDLVSDWEPIDGATSPMTITPSPAAPQNHYRSR